MGSSGVDEAHHLQWSPEQASPAYTVVERISNIANGLLLLTATPEQLGRLGHFARLRLLDPSRYYDYEQFLLEETHFTEVAERVAALLDSRGAKQTQARTALRALLGEAGQDLDDAELIDAVLDRHGTGRVLFRNVRASVKGFPQRLALPYPLTLKPGISASIGYFPETDLPDWTRCDPRIPWLTNLLDSHPDDKFLLICAHQQTVLDLEQRLAALLPIRTTVFHEGLDLVARDRAANYFAETDRGAQLMICSEIGSEGRNFQFASHLVLFDLPLGPDQLAQRIGRLDRIGQAQDFKIHTPYIDGTGTERLYQWYAKGLNLFCGPNAVAQSIFDELIHEFATADFDEFLQRSAALNAERLSLLQQGRDRLLELNSHRPSVSATIVTDIQQHGGGQSLAKYMERSFSLFGLESEFLGDQVLLVKPGDTMVRHVSVSAETQDHFHYPELPEDGLRITYDRDTALAREDVLYLTWEHPLVQQAMDIVATDTNGNSAMIAVKHPELPAGTLLLETLFIADCVAPAYLMADRFLPPAVIRVVIEPNFADISDTLAWTDFDAEQLSVSTGALQGILESQRAGIKSMLEAAKRQARTQCQALRESARARAETLLDVEIKRLTALKGLNDNVRPEEISHLLETRRLTLEAIDQADIRLDSIRVIVAA
ncbi:MAG: RNA polymerase-associated protein RapA [SAR86 cluster bacterium]